jgi:hypothetical protein
MGHIHDWFVVRGNLGSMHRKRLVLLDTVADWIIAAQTALNIALTFPGDCQEKAAWTRT